MGASVQRTISSAKHFADGRISACCLVSLLCLVGIPRAPQRSRDSTEANQVDVIGDWGGPHLAMSVTSNGASLEFDCAHGQFDEPLRPDRQGRFAVHGIYVAEHGGPTRKGETPKSRAAAYTGTIKVDQMTISAKLLDADQEIGTFVVRRDQPARLFKCR